MRQPGFDLRTRARSLRYAASGIALMVRTQHNAWLHLTATGFVCGLGFWLRITAADWRWLVVAIILVWVAEAVNTSFEHLCDVVSPEFHGIRPEIEGYRGRRGSHLRGRHGYFGTFCLSAVLGLAADAVAARGCSCAS
jgi:diacylglycerol kinase